MTKEQFESKVNKCCRCGSIPTLVGIKNFIRLDEDTKGQFISYRIVCEKCKWEDGSMTKSKTGTCSTEENAVKSWNKKNKKDKKDYDIDDYMPEGKTYKDMTKQELVDVMKAVINDISK